MNTTSYEKGLEKGREEGREKGKREVLREQLENRFGPLSEEVLERLQQLPTDRLRNLARDILRADSLRELGLAD